MCDICILLSNVTCKIIIIELSNNGYFSFSFFSEIFRNRRKNRYLDLKKKSALSYYLQKNCSRNVQSMYCFLDYKWLIILCSDCQKSLILLFYIHFSPSILCIRPLSINELSNDDYLYFSFISEISLKFKSISLFLKPFFLHYLLWRRCFQNNSF